MFNMITSYMICGSLFYILATVFGLESHGFNGILWAGVIGFVISKIQSIAHVFIAIKRIEKMQRENVAQQLSMTPEQVEEMEKEAKKILDEMFKKLAESSEKDRKDDPPR